MTKKKYICISVRKDLFQAKKKFEKEMFLFVKISNSHQSIFPDRVIVLLRRIDRLRWECVSFLDVSSVFEMNLMVKILYQLLNTSIFSKRIVAATATSFCLNSGWYCLGVPVVSGVLILRTTHFNKVSACCLNGGLHCFAFADIISKVLSSCLNSGLHCGLHRLAEFIICIYFLDRKWILRYIYKKQIQTNPKFDSLR